MDIKRHVVLVHPEIPWNTGCVGRSCLGVGAVLHLIEPLGFSIDAKEVKRAGLDYWPRVDLRVWPDFATFIKEMKPLDGEIFFFTKKAGVSFRKMPVLERMFLVFGSETSGLPEKLTKEYSASCLYIPLLSEIRSLNLSTAVGIALFESLRGVDILHAW